MNEVPEGERISSGAMAPLILALDKSPPALTIVIDRKHCGIRLSDLFLATKNPSWILLSGCRPCSHGKTCLGSGKGREASSSNARANVSASIEYTVGFSRSLGKLFGGYRTQSPWTEVECLRVGEAGGVVGILEFAGAGPGGQAGRCLFGIGGWPWEELALRLRAGAIGGGDAECRTGCCCTTTVAIMDEATLGGFCMMSPLFVLVCCRGRRLTEERYSGGL